MKRIAAVTVELIGGVLMGAPCAYVGGAVGSMWCEPPVFGTEIEWDCSLELFYGATIGYVLGLALGICFAGHMLGQKGSFWLTVLGGAFGGALSVLLMTLTQGALPEPLWAVVIVLPLALATVSHNL